MMSRSVCIALLGLFGAVLSQVALPAPNGPFGARPFYPGAQGVYPGAQGVYPGVQGPFVPIVAQNYDLNPDGSYNFGYQSADGSSRREEGQVKYPAAPGAPGYAPQGGDLSVQGNYAYVSPEGAQIEVSYLADENGYQPSGPGIHPAILKAVAFQVAQARAENGQGPGAIPIGGPAPFAPNQYPAYPSTPFARPVRSVVKASQ